MKRALTLALEAEGNTSPNPMVGCVIVDDEGNIGIGPAAASDWQGRELDFLAPELFWRGQPSAASDVYSVGMLMY